MKKKSALLLSLILGCSVCGCTSEETKPATLQDILQPLENTPTKGGVQKAFNELLDLNITAWEESFSMAEEIQISDLLQSSDENVSSPEDSQDSLHTWMYSGDTLYEVLRYSASAGSEPYIGLIEVSPEKTVQVNAVPANPEVNVFTDHPLLVLDYSQEDENKALKNQDEKETKNAILSEITRSLTFLFGSGSPIPPYSEPSLYDFKTEEHDGQTSLTITLKTDEDSKKKAADLLKDADAKDLKDAQFLVVFSESGQILKAWSSVEAGGRVTETRCVFQKAGSNQEAGFLEDLFNQIEDRSLPVKSTFTLEMKGAMPADLIADAFGTEQ